MKYGRLVMYGITAAFCAAAGCSPIARDNSFDDTESGSGGSGASGSMGNGVGTESGIGSGFNPTGGTGGSGSTGSNCMNPPEGDGDNDGFTGLEGDCNNCDPNVNPGAIEVVITEPDDMGNVPEPADENCDTLPDNVVLPCDSGIALADFDPLNGAKAIDICEVATPADKKWGVLEAKYVRGNGSPAAASPHVGIFDGFGPNVPVQKGERMLSLSSGYARLPGQPDACGTQTCSTYGGGSAPAGFPQDNPNCPPSSNINDDVGLEVKMRSPTNATGYSFRFKFYSFEYPEWVCTSYNDQFIALATPEPQGSFNGNISFDSMNNPVSVNIGFFDVCPGCPLGTAELVGTGFDSWDDAGATGWLQTQAPVTGGEEVTLRFFIFDTGDAAWDSTALIDGFEWVASGGTVVVGTQPADPPK
jgi:hypothetical protein